VSVSTLLREAKRDLERLRRLRDLGDARALVSLGREKRRRGLVHLLNLDPEKLPAPVRVKKGLARSGWTLRDVLTHSVSDVLRKAYIGRKSVRFLSALLFAMGYRWGLAMSRPGIIMPNPASERPWNGWSTDTVDAVIVDTGQQLSSAERHQYVDAFYRAYNVPNPAG